MENMIFEMTDDEKIITYEINFNVEKIEEFKKKLLKFSVVQEKKIIYDPFYYYDAEEYCNRVLKLKFDNLNVISHKELPDDTIEEIVNLKYYPYLHKVLFEANEENIFSILLTYIEDENFNKDKNINNNQRINLVSKFLSSITIKIIHEDSVNDIKNQISVIQTVSDNHSEEKKALLDSINNRLKRAKCNKESLNKILELINKSLNKALSLKIE